eukprot:CAMPEP_0118961244 /NCGR_PEP_ID=MMETSP1169-20130426/64044_1 /TAXON_ID=36882 /ORGANISM="Pyramimonas obovata, Strain CCMP722" /LENGTH=244 /DNA_ID=CAMNT_0006909397 /DNA_START=92 /DNA_END=825 /DNA_ORIENTATION=+
MAWLGTFFGENLAVLVDYTGVVSNVNPNLCLDVRKRCKQRLTFFRCQNGANRYDTNVYHQNVEFTFPIVDSAVYAGSAPAVIWWRFNLIPMTKQILQAAFPKTKIVSGTDVERPEKCDIHNTRYVYQRTQVFSGLIKHPTAFPRAPQLCAEVILSAGRPPPTRGIHVAATLHARGGPPMGEHRSEVFRGAATPPSVSVTRCCAGDNPKGPLEYVEAFATKPAWSTIETVSKQPLEGAVAGVVSV